MLEDKFKKLSHTLEANDPDSIAELHRELARRGLGPPSTGQVPRYAVREVATGEWEPNKGGAWFAQVRRTHRTPWEAADAVHALVAEYSHRSYESLEIVEVTHKEGKVTKAGPSYEVEEGAPQWKKDLVKITKILDGVYLSDIHTESAFKETQYRRCGKLAVGVLEALDYPGEIGAPILVFRSELVYQGLRTFVAKVHVQYGGV